MNESSASNITLYGYWRSSASYRVRMALNLKGIDYQQQPVHLVRDGGQQHAPAYRAINPQGQVPTLLHDGHQLIQSMAILEYLEERFPAPPLLPDQPAGRARVRALANVIACDTHPLNNLRVLKYLTGPMQQDEAVKQSWYRHWMANGMDAFEQLLQSSDHTGQFCHGDQPTIADCCLLPQVYNARRFDCDESGWPEITRIAENLQAISEIQHAAPENQPDAQH